MPSFPMAVRYKHADIYSMYFCTFTCYKWMHLFEITNSYDLVYNWFKVLKDKSNCGVIAFVIMPNHLHCILYFNEAGFELDKIVSNGKRFMAYEMVKRLKQDNTSHLLTDLREGLTEREKKKGQLHKVFESSFDAKAVYSEKFLLQKINYIHQNPVSGKWNLATDFTGYAHSSAAFYELDIEGYFTPLNYADI
jgi:REP element-mobilizing transposase RayT